MTFLFILLALLALGFLIFIHELGHLIMARRVGMKVESFNIGFGPVIYSWKFKGVLWQLKWLPFGGSVKIAGMEKQDNKEPYEIADGFFGGTPWARIKVALMGPLVNIVFAFLIFCGIWLGGGREKPFSEYTHRVGWIDPSSELYKDGVRPGDAILKYDGHSLTTSKDHLYAPMMADKQVYVQGMKIDYQNGQETPFGYTVPVYPYPAAVADKGLKTIGILSAASYLIYDRLPNGAENPLPEGSPMRSSGIQYGDRLFWVDGEEIFSLQQMKHLINEERALLTIQRGKEILLARVPRLPLGDFKLDANVQNDFNDWYYEAHFAQRFQQSFAIPYHLTPDTFVENKLAFFDADVEQRAFPEVIFAPIDAPLQLGDKILAVDGVPVHSSMELFRAVQQHRLTIMVERSAFLTSSLSWKQADSAFDRSVQWKDVDAIANSIGTSSPIRTSGNMVLLNPTVPVTAEELARASNKSAFAAEMDLQKARIAAIRDPELRAQELKALEVAQQQLLLGVSLQDRNVVYNPSPFALFDQASVETWRTLRALVTGSLNPKWLSGPVGIVQVIHYGWSLGTKEGLFWVAIISLNLGFFNLLPIPVLDGGYIFLSIWEWLTRRRLKAKTMERLVIPFIVVLIGFFIFVTYQDVARLLNQWF